MNTFTRRFGLKMGAALGAMAAAGNLVSITYAEVKPIGEPDPELVPTVGGEVVIGANELGDTLDPHKTGSAAVSTTLRYCSDSLIAKDFDGNYIGSLATDWTISEDGLIWTFNLRQDVTFHDGTPLDANAVKFSFDRILDPETKSITAAGSIGPMKSTAVVDDYTFQFTLETPFAPLLDNLTGSTVSIVSPTAVASMGADFGRKPVLTGAWMVDEWREGDRIILKRNPNYAWAPAHLHQDPAGAFIETIVFQSIIEEASRMAAFEAGEIDQSALPAVDIERIQSSGDFSVINYLRKGVVFLEFNITKAPFDDVKVRQAFNHAINKQDAFDAAVEGYGSIANGFLSPTIFGYWDGIADYAPAYDTEKALALFAEAGWVPNGDGKLEKDGKTFSFTALNLPSDSWNRAAQVIQSQLGDIGIAMEIQQLEFATLLEQAKAGSHDAEFMGYTYSDPDIAYLWFHSSQAGAGLNLSHVNDPDVDKLIMDGRASVDLTERAAIYEELQRKISDLGLWVPLWSDDYYIAFSKRIVNATFHPDNFTNYYDASIVD
jgi:peptide/nickel transport system substrate-binding protein